METFLTTSTKSTLKSNLLVGIEDLNTEINSQYFDKKKLLEKATGRRIISFNELHQNVSHLYFLSIVTLILKAAIKRFK